MASTPPPQVLLHLHVVSEERNAHLVLLVQNVNIVVTTSSDTTGTIPQESESFIDFNSFYVCYKQTSDTESEDIFVYFNMIYFIL
jgi:hypothetical protein